MTPIADLMNDHHEFAPGDLDAGRDDSSVPANGSSVPANGSSVPANGLTLELTGPLARIVGCGEIQIPSDAHDRLGRVIGRLVRKHPDAAPFLAEASFLEQSEGAFPPGILVIRDGAAIAARLDTPVAPGERLTLMPMISGG